MKQILYTKVQPDFIVKSTLGVAFVTIFLLTPFSVNNIVKGRYLLGGLVAVAILLCAVNAYLCYRGRYIRSINLFGISPVITIAIAIAILKLG